jgi:hypothetical protein
MLIKYGQRVVVFSTRVILNKERDEKIEEDIEEDC